MPALHKSRDDLHQSGTSTPKLRSNIIPLTRVYDVQLGKQNTEGGRDRQAAEDYMQRQNKLLFFSLTSCICSSVSWDQKLMINIFAQASWHTVAACSVTGKYHFQRCFMDT